MKIELINNIEANKYLKNLNMHIGNWAGIHHDEHLKASSLLCTPKKDCNDLFVLSTHIASWLPADNEWTIIQFDYSNSFDDTIHNSFVSSVLNMFDLNLVTSNERTLLLKDISSSSQYRFLLSKLIFLFILFEMHGYIVNSSCKNSGELISFQDGSLYFISTTEESQKNINSILEIFQKNKNKYQDWLSKENILLQEKNIL